MGNATFLIPDHNELCPQNSTSKSLPHSNSAFVLSSLATVNASPFNALTIFDIVSPCFPQSTCSTRSTRISVAEMPPVAPGVSLPATVYEASDSVFTGVVPAGAVAVEVLGLSANFVQ